MRVCSIVARNYLAHARVLARTFLAHNPGGEISVVVLDDEDGAGSSGDEPFEVLRPLDIGIDRREYHRMATIYDVTELATAVKPWLLATLLGRGGGPVTYLDPDMQVFASVADADRFVAERAMALTPHTLCPMPRDGLAPDETHLLRSGTFNLGFISVGGGSGPLLDWWKERLARDCVVSFEEGLFVDQRWIDIATVYFPPKVVHDPGWNVAYWNLQERPLARSADGTVTAGGEPLRFFHFSAFDPHRPDLLSRHQVPEPRHRPSNDPVLEGLCTGYADLLLAAGYDEARRTPYRFARSTGGIALTRDLRRRYRLQLSWGDEVAAALPDPFDPTQDSPFRAWVQATRRRLGREASPLKDSIARAAVRVVPDRARRPVLDGIRSVRRGLFR